MTLDVLLSTLLQSQIQSAATQAEHSTQIGDLIKAVNALNSAVASLEKENTSLQSAQRTLLEENTKLTSHIVGLENAVVQLGGQVRELERSSRTQVRRISKCEIVTKEASILKIIKEAGNKTAMEISDATSLLLLRSLLPASALGFAYLVHPHILLETILIKSSNLPVLAIKQVLGLAVIALTLAPVVDENWKGTAWKYSKIGLSIVAIHGSNSNEFIDFVFGTQKTSLFAFNLTAGRGGAGQLDVGQLTWTKHDLLGFLICAAQIILLFVMGGTRWGGITLAPLLLVVLGFSLKRI